MPKNEAPISLSKLVTYVFIFLRPESILFGGMTGTIPKKNMQEISEKPVIDPGRKMSFLMSVKFHFFLIFELLCWNHSTYSRVKLPVLFFGAVRIMTRTEVRFFAGGREGSSGYARY